MKKKQNNRTTEKHNTLTEEVQHNILFLYFTIPAGTKAWLWTDIDTKYTGRGVIRNKTKTFTGSFVIKTYVLHEGKNQINIIYIYKLYHFETYKIKVYYLTKSYNKKVN